MDNSERSKAYRWSKSFLRDICFLLIQLAIYAAYSSFLGTFASIVAFVLTLMAMGADPTIARAVLSGVETVSSGGAEAVDWIWSKFSTLFKRVKSTTPEEAVA